MTLVRTETLALLSLALAACRAAPSDEATDPSPTEVDRTMRVTKPSDTEIVLQQTFAAARQRVFAALTEPDHLRQWMGTKQMQLVESAVDLRVGGALRHVFRRSSGRQLEVRGVFTAIEAGRHFTYTESYDFSPLVLQCATTLEETKTGTRVEQRMLYATKAERDADFDPVATSATESWARLARHLAGG